MLWLWCLCIWFNIADCALLDRGPYLWYCDNVSHAIIFLVTGFLLSAVMRSVLKERPNIRFLNYCSVIVYGMIFGTICSSYPSLMSTFGSFFKLDLRDISMIYIPILTFRISFCIEHYALFKSLKQILIISVFSSTINVFFTGYLMSVILDQDWAFIEIANFGMMTYPIYPVEIISFLTRLGVHTKHTVTLLEGETLFGFVHLMTWSSLLVVHALHPDADWVDYVMVIAVNTIGGFLLGLLMGIFGRLFMRMCRNRENDIYDVATITICLSFLSSYALFVRRTLGVVSVAVVGVTLALELATYPPKSAMFLRKLWAVSCELSNIVILMCHGVFLATKVWDYFYLTDIALTFVTYVISICGRFISFLVLMPILKRIGWGLTLEQMLICCWGGLKSPLVLMLSLLHRNSDEEHGPSQLFIMHACTLYLWTLIINGSTLPLILNLLGVGNISVMRVMNMNTCLKSILEAKERTIDILKMDRFFSDANWEVVQKFTTLAHPYQKAVGEANNDRLEADVVGGRTLTCPDCKTEIPHQPTESEFREMIKEARMRILKTRRISYVRQYENGFLSKSALRFLVLAVDSAMDDEDVVLDMTAMEKLFTSTTCCHYIFKRYIQTLFNVHPDTLRVPKKKFRKFCHNLIIRPCFDNVICALILLNTCTIIWSLIVELKEESRETLKVTFSFAFSFTVIYTLECFVKIMGYSWIYVWQHGVKTYFKSWMNRIDFALLFINYLNIAMYLMGMLTPAQTASPAEMKVLTVFSCLRILRVLILYRLLKPCYPSLLLFWDRRVDVAREFAFLAGNGYVTASREIMRVLTTMIDNDAVREDIKNMLEAENSSVIKWMGMTQKDRPWIAVTVKTRQTSRALLNYMREAVFELKTDGWTDVQEHHKLEESLEKIEKAVVKIKAVQPCEPKVLFAESLWLGGNMDIIPYLYKNIFLKKYDTEDMVVAEGEMIDGLIMLVTGLLMQRYFPNKAALAELKGTGSLPIVDYINSNEYMCTANTLIIPGNGMGGLCMLTQRPYNCTITAAEYSQVFIIRREFLLSAMEMDPDPVDGLEARIWKVVSIRLALTVLAGIPAYQSLSHEKISFILQRGFVPDLSCFKIFIKNELILDVILIEGIVVDFNTRDIYTAPCYIPRTVNKLMLPRNSISAITKKPVQTKLFILPEKDVDEYDIMESEQETGEMVAVDSAKCLKHIAIVKYKLRRKMKAKKSYGSVTKKGTGSELSKYRSAYAVSSTKSHITFGADAQGRKSSEAVTKTASHFAVRSSASRSLRSIKEEATESNVSIITDVFDNEKIKKKRSK